MADTVLSMRPSESQHLYSAWRRAIAEWELARHAPDDIGSDLPAEVDMRHCNETHSAFMAFILHPAADLKELARKLNVADQEDASGYTDAGKILAAFAQDAHRLAFGFDKGAA